MKPYYEDESVQIFHGDCREWMPAADVIVTDPPYGIAYAPASGGRGFRSRGGKAIGKTWADKGVLVQGDSEPFDPAHLLALGIPSVLWGGNHFADRLPGSPTWFVWDKRDGYPSNDFADCEMAWTNLGGPARLFSHRWMGLMKDSERGQRRVHPTQKPVALMRWCIEKTPTGAVLDPYAGSGTTLVAAKSLGRKSIGIEIDEAHCEQAALRCSQEVLGLSA